MHATSQSEFDILDVVVNLKFMYTLWASSGRPHLKSEQYIIQCTTILPTFFRVTSWRHYNSPSWARISMNIPGQKTRPMSPPGKEGFNLKVQQWICTFMLIFTSFSPTNLGTLLSTGCMLYKDNNSIGRKIASYQCLIVFIIFFITCV